MLLVGELSLWVALLMAAWATTVSFAGGAQRRAELIESGARAIYASCGFTLIAAVGIWTALFAHDFSLKLVAANTTANLPTLYTFSALWAGSAGSLLLWTLLLVTCAAIAVASNRRSNRHVMPYVAGTLGAIMLFFLLALCFGDNPYERLDWVPPDGVGMNPQLQQPGMAMHPPVLYLGLVASAVPFALAIGALLARTIDEQWLATIRRWSLFGWFCLTVGIALGMRWAYRTPGWSGYWTWDAVQNASLLPWLACTALLHSIVIQEKRGVLRKWNLALVVCVFLLALLATFIARSDAIPSLHAFSRSPVADWILALVIVACAVSAWLVSRFPGARLHSAMDRVITRETAMLAGSLVLLTIALVTLSGTIFPLLAEASNGSAAIVDARFFNRTNGAIGLLVLAAMGLASVLGWQRASLSTLPMQLRLPITVGIAIAASLVAFGMRDAFVIASFVLAGVVLGAIAQEFAHGIRACQRMFGISPARATLRLLASSRRVYGGYIVHLGVALLFCAFTGMSFRRSLSATVHTGEQVSGTDPYGHSWIFTSQGISRFDVLNRNVLSVTFDVARDGRHLGILSSEKRQHVNAAGEATFEPSTEVGVLSTLREDVYLEFAGATDAETASVVINFNPLVTWVWYGALIMALGGVIVMWPRAQQSVRPEEALDHSELSMTSSANNAEAPITS